MLTRRFKDIGIEALGPEIMVKEFKEEEEVEDKLKMHVEKYFHIGITGGTKYLVPHVL